MESCRRIRIRLGFPAPGVSFNRKVWMLVDLGQCKSMSDISYLIKKRYKLSTPSSSLALFLEGYLLPPDESVHIIKDNDIIDVAAMTDGDDSDKEMRKKKKPKIKISGEKKVEPKRSTTDSDSDSDSDSSSSDKGGAPPSCKSHPSSVHTKRMLSSAKPSTTSTSSVKLSSLKPSTNKPVSTSKPLPTVSTGKPKLSVKPSTIKPKPSVKPSTSKPKPSVKPSTGKKPLVIKPPIIKPSTSILTSKPSGKKGGPSTNKPSASGLSIDQRHKPCILTRPMTGSPTSVAKTASHVHFSSDDEESHSSQTGPMITTNDGPMITTNDEVIENKDYSQFPPLTSLPKAGDTIAFKTLELSPEDYTPLVSDYKEGQVLQVQDNEQSIVIKLSDITLAREKKKSEKEIEGKFAFPDSLPVEPESEIEISFSDLIQPILLQ